MPLSAIKDKENTAEELTLQQVLPICAIRDDELINLEIDTDERTTRMTVCRGEAAKLLSPDILSSRVSLIQPSVDGGRLTLTVKPKR